MSVYDDANAVGRYRYGDPGVRPKAVRNAVTNALAEVYLQALAAWLTVLPSASNARWPVCGCKG